jgi:hypothetical protein
MNMSASQYQHQPFTPIGESAQPNDFDRRRVERSLRARKRYRYVEPQVHTTTDGYLIESPCCSRNVDPDGGVIDIALIQYVPGPRPWRLYHKNHEADQWLIYSLYSRLVDLLEALNSDPHREFWQ